MGLISESHPINGTTPGNDAITEQGRQCPPVSRLALALGNTQLGRLGMPRKPETRVDS